MQSDSSAPIVPTPSSRAWECLDDIAEALDAVPYGSDRAFVAQRVQGMLRTYRVEE